MPTLRMSSGISAWCQCLTNALGSELNLQPELIFEANIAAYGAGEYEHVQLTHSAHR